MKNWKTTLSGIASIISGIALYLNHPDQIEAAITAVTLGFGLLFAKDHNVSHSVEDLKNRRNLRF